jgi:dCTP deaminase
VALLEYEALTDALGAQELCQRLVVMPLLDPDTQIGPASIDLRLGTRFRVLRRTAGSGIDPLHHLQADLERGQDEVTVAFGKPLWLHPEQFVLGATLEFLRFPAHLGGYVVGRSSWGRAGLLVATAIMVHPGFAGCLTLELVNHGESPIALYPGARIAQIAVHSLAAATSRAYVGRYVGPTGPEIGKLEKEQREIEQIERVAQRLGGSP